MPITEQELRNHFGRRFGRKSRAAATLTNPCDIITDPSPKELSVAAPTRIHQAAETVPPQFRSSPTVREAFSTLLVALADNPPVDIVGEADSTDMEERAEHTQAVLDAVAAYFDRLLTDAKHRTSGLDFDVHVLGILNDTNGDLVGTFKIAAERMLELDDEF
jgi:hypothetical protein